MPDKLNERRASIRTPDPGHCARPNGAISREGLLVRQVKVWSPWFQHRVQFGLVVGLTLAILLCPETARGQLSKAVTASKAAPQEPEKPQDALHRTTPRGTVLGFLNAAYNQKYDIAAQYLNTRATGRDAANLARQLFFVLDRGLPAKLNNVSNDPLGSQTDPVDSRRELIGSVVTERGGGVDVYLERVDRPDGPSIWLFSRQTLADIPDVYDEINTTAVESMVPDFLFRRYFGVTLFGWTFFLLFLPLLYVALSLINRLVGAGVGYALRRWAHRENPRNLTILPHPVRLLILSATVFLTLREVDLSLIARQAGSTMAALLLIAAFVWAMFLVNARCEVYLKRRMESRGRLSATAVLRPLRSLMDLIAVIVGFIFFLHTFGINPTATLAGLGVGGIAIALAAQKTLENVIGGASLIMDGVVRVGETFRIGDVVGTIEIIGLRSTRVRTLDRTMVTIPNGQMATMTLENLSARDQFWLRHLIEIEFGTEPTALNSVLADVRSLLERDARVIRGSTRVRFLRFAESSLELEVFAYVVARDWNQFLEIQEDVLIKIRQLINAAGAMIACPSRAIYLKNEIGVDGSSLQATRGGPISDADKEARREIHRR
jgi:MscS family membrane protein